MNEDFTKYFFCYKCSLQFESRSVFNLHLKLLHKEDQSEDIIKKEVVDYENETKIITNLAWKCTKSEIDFETKESLDFHSLDW